MKGFTKADQTEFDNFNAAFGIKSPSAMDIAHSYDAAMAERVKAGTLSEEAAQAIVQRAIELSFKASNPELSEAADRTVASLKARGIFQ